jgi:hypothetical protein
LFYTTFVNPAFAKQTAFIVTIWGQKLVGPPAPFDCRIHKDVGDVAE